MLVVHVEKNVKLAVYDLNPNGKRTILMIHGWPLSGKIFEYQQEVLVKSGFRVITLDLRGMGNSDAPAHGYNYSRLATDIYQVVKTLRLSNFTLAGFSMGGAIALRYMGLFNGYGVNKLCLLAAAAPCYTIRPGFPYGVKKQKLDEYIIQASTDRPSLCQVFSQMLLHSPHSSAVKDWFKDIALMASGIGTIGTAFSLRDEDVRPDIARVCVPTAIFHGRQDKIVPFELGIIQHKSLPGSIFYTFDNSGHGIFYDELATFNEWLLEFLNLS